MGNAPAEWATLRSVLVSVCSAGTTTQSLSRCDTSYTWICRDSALRRGEGLRNNSSVVSHGARIFVYYAQTSAIDLHGVKF